MKGFSHSVRLPATAPPSVKTQHKLLAGKIARTRAGSSIGRVSSVFLRPFQQFQTGIRLLGFWFRLGYAAHLGDWGSRLFKLGRWLGVVDAILTTISRDR
jgi:hypothetical protein